MTDKKLQDHTGPELAKLYNLHSIIHQVGTKSLSEPKEDFIKKIEALPSYKASKGGAPTIRIISLLLMCHAVYYEDRTQKSGEENRVGASHPNARSVGIPYLEIIDRIKQKFPNANTSVACLRWYAVKARVEEFGYEGFPLVQRRPRAKSK